MLGCTHESAAIRPLSCRPSLALLTLDYSDQAPPLLIEGVQVTGRHIQIRLGMVFGEQQGAGGGGFRAGLAQGGIELGGETQVPADAGAPGRFGLPRG